jgi:hypothetical protein
MVNHAKVTLTNMASSNLGWKVPALNQVKLIVDASFHGDTQQGATGATVRNEKGQFFVTSNSFLQHTSSPFTAEVVSVCGDATEVVSVCGTRARTQ